MPLWLSGGALLIGDDGLILCDECPCGGPQTIYCSAGEEPVAYLFPESNSGNYEVVLSGFGGGLELVNGTWLIESNTGSDPDVNPWYPGSETIPVIGLGFLRIGVDSHYVQGGLCLRSVYVDILCGGPLGSFFTEYRITDTGPVTIDQRDFQEIPMLSVTPGDFCYPSGTVPGTVSYRCIE